MALIKKITEALNKQFNEELNSAYIYDSMAADFNAKNFPGFSSWMTAQAEEEREHAVKIQEYLNNHGERVYHAAIPEPQAEWDSPLAIFEAALAHEQHITKCIHELVNLARDENDLATAFFLIWFIEEQVEEEAAAQGNIDKLKMIGDSKYGLYKLDKEFLSRGEKND